VAEVKEETGLKVVDVDLRVLKVRERVVLVVEVPVRAEPTCWVGEPGIEGDISDSVRS
jgi:hypothetical protein